MPHNSVNRTVLYHTNSFHPLKFSNTVWNNFSRQNHH